MGSLKIPQIGVEIKFLGLKFAFLRAVLILISVTIIGLIIEGTVERKILKKEGGNNGNL